VTNSPASPRSLRTFGRWHYAIFALAFTFLVLHLIFLPRSLEDLDSINFALGIRHFDVAQHQPHPPGYPIYIVVARLANLVVRDEARALAVVSALAGALGTWALTALFLRLDRRAPSRWAITAAVVTVVCPLYWLTAARPLSDVPGLAAATAIQVVILSATSISGLFAAAGLSGVAIGIRSQIAWLTIPLLLYVCGRRRLVAGRREETGRGTGMSGLRTVMLLAGAFLVGVAFWAIPLLVATGGVAAYWRALFAQGAEDLTGIQMLWTTPTLRQGLVALYYAFVAPWGNWPLAVSMLALSALGIVVLYRTALTSLQLLAVAFGPYLVFDLLFQESFTGRYALPLVAPIAYLAVRTVATLPNILGMAVAVGISGVAASNAVNAAVSYSSMPAPVFRLIEAFGSAAAIRPPGAPSPVLAMHRREDLDLRRPFQWTGSRMPPFSRRLAAPPKREWLELVTYWNAGGDEPVWFIADPQRTDIALIDHAPGRHATYRWPLAQPELISGVRPNEMDWYVLDSPGWYLGEGWALTPETAGVAQEDHRGPGIQPIAGWIRRRPEAVTLLVGGRNLAAEGASARVTVEVDGRAIDEIAAPPGFFLRFIRLPEGALGGDGRYAQLSIRADQPRVSIEQFDAQSDGRLAFGFADGWHEMEYNPATGRSWRWMSEHAVIRLKSEPRALTLTVSGTTEGFSRPTAIKVRVGERILGESRVTSPFTIHAQIPADVLGSDETAVVVETDQFYVPAERSRRTQDRRHLALRVYDLQLRPAS
jgi:hypothetical protein